MNTCNILPHTVHDKHKIILRFEVHRTQKGSAFAAAVRVVMQRAADTIITKWENNYHYTTAGSLLILHEASRALYQIASGELKRAYRSKNRLHFRYVVCYTRQR